MATQLERPDIDNFSLEGYDETREVPIPTEADLELAHRFSHEVVGPLAKKWLEEGTDQNLIELAGERQFVVGYIPAESEFSDVARSVEATVFSKVFKEPLTKVVEEYGHYDPMSTMIAVVDITTPGPTPAGAVRMTDYDPELGLKDVNDLVIADEDNPWLEEIVRGYFEVGENYDPALAWKRLGEVAAGHELLLPDSIDVATHASADGYRGKNGTLDSTSMQFYHACLRYAQANKKDNLLAIYDIPPLRNLQQFGRPFNIYPGLQPHPYGGQYPTLPAYCIIPESAVRLQEFDQANGTGVHDLFVKGANLEQFSLMPNEYDADNYSNEAVGVV